MHAALAVGCGGGAGAAAIGRQALPCVEWMAHRAAVPAARAHRRGRPGPGTPSYASELNCWLARCHPYLGGLDVLEDGLVEALDGLVPRLEHTARAGGHVERH